MEMIFLGIDMVVAAIIGASMVSYLDDYTHLDRDAKLTIILTSSILFSMSMIVVVYLRMTINLAILFALICTLLLLRTKLKIARIIANKIAKRQIVKGRNE